MVPGWNDQWTAWSINEHTSRRMLRTGAKLSCSETSIGRVLYLIIVLVSLVITASS